MQRARRRRRCDGAAKPGITHRRAALLLRVGITEDEAREADGGRLLSSIVAARAHIVGAEEATRRAPAGTPKALQWIASDLSLLSGRRARLQDVRRWLACNAPGVLAARLAAWEEGTAYLAAAHQRGRWSDPDARIVRWEARREYAGARP